MMRDDQERTWQLEKDAEKAIPAEEEAWAHSQTCERSWKGRYFVQLELVGPCESEEKFGWKSRHQTMNVCVQL